MYIKICNVYLLFLLSQIRYIIDFHRVLKNESKFIEPSHIGINSYNKIKNNYNCKNQ